MSVENGISYSATTDVQWTVRAYALLGSDDLKVELLESGAAPCLVVKGPCPRCDHSLVDRQTTVALYGLSGPNRSQGDSAVNAVSLDVTCACGVEHQGAPEGVTGCGVSFRLEVAAP
ncbi:hypothetical protein ACFVFS_18785 [Kitasatospora sp. NPDC057692]|uniref:hypothetical protein n=1 Tax=Kitasatospora sp. NPDC057692 TaxID=3346215 RepID=UPI00369F532A